MKPSTGYGGKYGVQSDRFDKSAVGFDYQINLEKHSSQTGFFEIIFKKINFFNLNYFFGLKKKIIRKALVENSEF